MFQRISDRFASEKALRSGDRLPPGQSLLVQSVTHAVVFGAVYYGLRMTFPQYY